ncbi:MAG: hypothetical protein ILO36_00900 [Abditibacteriota bacterium]|nr:hypothetical protein [Abditibacteriota bacterium]
MAKTDKKGEWKMFGGLPLALRTVLALGCWASGAAVFVSGKTQAGACIFAALAFFGLLLLCKRRLSAKPEDFSEKDKEWSRTTPEGLEAAVETVARHEAVKYKKLPFWAASLICAALLGIVTALLSSADPRLCIAVQALCFYVLPLSSGGVEDWCPKRLITVAPQQLAALSLKDRYRDRATFTPQIACDKRYSVPLDAKLSIGLKGAPEGFYGITVQTTIANAIYPFTYCVIAAKKELGMDKAFAALDMEHSSDPFIRALSDKRRCRYKTECKTETDVTVILILLKSKDEYETSLSDVMNMTESAIAVAEAALGSG